MSYLPPPASSAQPSAAPSGLGGHSSGSPYPSAAYVAPSLPPPSSTNANGNGVPGQGQGQGQLSAYQRARTVSDAPGGSVGAPGDGRTAIAGQGDRAYAGVYSSSGTNGYEVMRYDAPQGSVNEQAGSGIPQNQTQGRPQAGPSGSAAQPQAAPEKPKAPPRKRKKPAAPAYDGPDYYASSTQAQASNGGGGGAASRSAPGVRKDSLGRVMNSASHSGYAQAAAQAGGGGGGSGSRRAGSVMSGVRGGGGDDASVASGAKGSAEPNTIDDLNINFEDLPDETTWRYLGEQALLPLFAGGKASPAVGGAACDPKYIFSETDPETEAEAARARARARRQRRAEREREMAGEDAVEPEVQDEAAQAAAAEEGAGDANVPGEQPPAVGDVEMKEAGVEGDKPADGPLGDGATAEASGADGTDTNPAPEEEEEVIIPPESPPALRRSSRRPGANQRPARDSPSRSPTPTTSEDEDEDEDPADAAERRRFKPILADIDAVKAMLQQRANADWLDALRHRSALASGLQHLSNSGGREGVVMVGAFGAHTKESDAVEDFLYRVKVGDHPLKIANQLPLTEL